MLIDKNKIKWVWVDLDDTLWDFELNSLKSLEKVYAHFGLDRWFNSPAEFIDSYHATNHALWADYNVGKISRDYLMRERFLRPLMAVNYPLEDDTWQRFSDYYLDRLAECQGTVPGAHELLHRLRAKGFRIGVLSNGFKEVQYRKMASAGLTDLIDCVVLSDEIGVNKPDRRLYDHAVAKAGTTAAESLIIGDNPDTDILGGINAGWEVIYFNRNGAGKPLEGTPTVTSLDMIEPV
ncbi:MAG: YjjG family noncanonical pyrimidine nucleotidase [Muribaculaceae bacterium]|nr:YjjG family noncanonical pyrimidine nucleotidase [Muribaculaceae bacterium]